MDLGAKVTALEDALRRLGVVFREEQLPEESAIDGGLCKIGSSVVVYLTPTAPPWRRAEVLLGALRSLPHEDLWLPPEIRGLLTDAHEALDDTAPFTADEDLET